MILTIDKDLATEKSIPIDRVSIRPVLGRLTASAGGAGAESAPDISGFTSEDIQNSSVTDDSGLALEFGGKYSKIEDLSLTYEQGGTSWFLNIALTGETAAE